MVYCVYCVISQCLIALITLLSAGTLVANRARLKRASCNVWQSRWPRNADCRIKLPSLKNLPTDSRRIYPYQNAQRGYGFAVKIDL